MKYTAQATVSGTPTFEVRARAEPIGVRGGLEGAVRARIGPINARVGRVPVVLAIPFLGGVRTIGAVGPFDLNTGPIDIAIDQLDLRCECVLGPDGLSGGLEGGVQCNWKIDLNGTVPGRVARASVEFADVERVEVLEVDELEVEP